jgi:hypothetical protein
MVQVQALQPLPLDSSTASGRWLLSAGSLHDRSTSLHTAGSQMVQVAAHGFREEQLET